MRRGVVAAFLFTTGVLSAGAAPGVLAQASASLEAGVSHVDYDGFLPSGAASLTPSLRLERAWAALTARGTALAFESGNTSLQGSLAASLYAPLSREWRAEVAGTLGGSRYEDFAEFWHALARARVHRISGQGGFWLGGSAGRTSYGAGSRGVIAAEVGGWARIRDVSLTTAISATGVGDTTWVDVEGFARWSWRSLIVDANGGFRAFSQGAGSGAYGELTGTYAVNDRLALVLGGGRYPVDPVRGSIAGRYATAALRVRLTGNAEAPAARLARAAADPVMAENGNLRARFDLEPVRGAVTTYELIIRAPLAERVEIMASFTDWEPQVLQRAADGTWRLRWNLPPGVHRLNVRLDGGNWVAPAGTTPMPDDFGGQVGVFVIG